ncbi:hypothetical protein FOZ62_027344, partial [Perkinsus olseni]
MDHPRLMPVMSVLEINSPHTAYFPAFLSLLIITIIMAQHGGGDRKFQHKLDDIKDRLWAPLVPIGKEAVVAAQTLAKKHPSDREAVLELLIAAATAEASTAEDTNLTAGLDVRPVGEMIGKHKVDESPSSPVCTPPHRAVRGFIIDMLVASMTTDDDAVFGQTEIISKMRSAAACEGLEGLDDAPWWLSLYVHDLGSARRMNSDRKMIFESEISELVARHPCRSLCRPVITEVLTDTSAVDVGLRPAIRRCLTVLPLDTLRDIISTVVQGECCCEGVRTTAGNPLLAIISSTRMMHDGIASAAYDRRVVDYDNFLLSSVPLTDYHTFANIISIIITAVGIPVDQALMLVLERLLRIVSSSGTRYDDAQVPGLIRILANIRQNGGANVTAETSLVLEVVVAICLWEIGDDLSCHTAEMLIECCPVVHSDDPTRDLLVAAVMALQDDRLSTGLDKKLSSQARDQVAPAQQREQREQQHVDQGLDVGCLPLAAMWLEWSKATMHASITNEDMPPLALATVLPDYLLWILPLLGASLDTQSLAFQLLYRLASAPEVDDEHPVVCLVSGRGFSLRMLPHLARLIPKLSPKGSEMLAYALAAHLQSHKEISKHAAVKPMVYRTMTTLFPLPLAAAAVARHLLRIMPDVYIDKMLSKLESGAASMEESYLQLLEAYTAEYPARVAGTHLDRVQQLLALERSDHARSRGLLMIRRLCMVLELAVDVPGWSGVEFIWKNIYEGSSSFNPYAWNALARVVRSRGRQFVIDGPPDQAGPLLAAFTPTTVVQLANDVIDNQLPEGKEDIAALASCLAAFADIDVSAIGRSAFIASSAVAEETTSNDISPLGRRLHGFLRTASRRSPLAQLAISKGPGGATLPVLRRLLSTVRVLPSGVFGGGYMLAMNWKKFMNRLVKSGDAKPVEIFDTLMDALPTNPGNALLALSALGRCRAMQFSMKARDAIEGVLYTKADILDSVRSLAVIALALLLGSLPYAQATATAEGLFASLNGPSSAGSDSTITTRLWMMPYWCLINHDKVEEVISRLVVGCKADPATAAACGYGLALLVTLHWGRPEVRQSLASRLKDTPPTFADLCARVLCGLDVGSH